MAARKEASFKLPVTSKKPTDSENPAGLESSC